MNTDSPLDRLRSKLEKILHLNGCQQRTAGYNDYIEKKDIDTDDMERLEALTLDEVMAEVELYSIAISHKQVIEARDSEQNRLFAILRHLGVKHDAKEIMRVRKEWDNLAEAKLRKTL